MPVLVLLFLEAEVTVPISLYRSSTVARNYYAKTEMCRSLIVITEAIKTSLDISQARFDSAASHPIDNCRLSLGRALAPAVCLFLHVPGHLDPENSRSRANMVESISQCPSRSLDFRLV